MSAHKRRTAPIDDLVQLLVPRSALITMLPQPLAVTQLNCEQIFGISAEEFTADARAQRFPNKRRGHKRIASVEDAAKFYLSAKDPSPKAVTQPKQFDIAAMMEASVARMRK